jgi:hypothetical protein
MSRLPSRTTRLTWVARGVLGGVRLGYTSMLTRGASPSLRYPPLAVIAAVATSFLGIQHALADGPTVTPAPGRLSGASSLVPGASTPSGALPLGTHEYHMIFDRPVSSFWHEASETWTFKGPTGKVICALPCQSWVDYPSRAYVEGSGISFGSTTRLALPDTFSDTGFLVQDEHAGNTLWARPNPGKGCPDCAVALGIISGASLAVGVGFLVLFAARSSSSSDAVAIVGLAGAALAGLVGLPLGIIALVWNANSERPRLDIFHAPPVPSSPLRVSFSSSGLVLSF